MPSVLKALRGGAVLAAVFAAAPLWAQGIKGPNSCFKCHAMAKEAWQTTAPFHKGSTGQLTAANAGKYAAAIGLASASAPNGACVACHATLVGGAPSEGVSCESCHGPATGYFKEHQDVAFYAKPEGARLGLRDLFNKPAAIAAMCVNCHVTPDPKLRAAGHPSGEKFDPGKGIAKMVHWPSDASETRKRTGYNAGVYAQISAAAAPLVAKRMSSAGPAVAGGTGGGQKAPPPPPAAGSGSAGGTTEPAATKPPNAGTGGTGPKPKPQGTPDPFDWDQPVKELPKDYPGNSGDATTPPPAGNSGRPPAGGGAKTQVAPPPPTKVAPAAQAPSTAPELPLTPAEPVAPPPAAALQSTSNVRTPASRVAEARGRTAAVLADLLKAKKGQQLDIPAPSAPQEFTGPDSELLRLQDEILYLALDALRKKDQ
jgi:hypothetical protein